MFVNIWRGSLPLRTYWATELANTFQAVSNISRGNVRHFMLCGHHPIPSPAIRLVASKVTLGVAKRFRSKVSHALKDHSEISENLTQIFAKPRAPRRRGKSQEQGEKGYPVVAFSTAEEFNLDALKVAISKQELYSVVEENEMFKVQESEHQGEDVVHIKARYNVDSEPREVFFFRDGTAVFWNVSDLEISNFLRFIRPFESGRYNEKLVLGEREIMSYNHGESKKTILRNDVIELASSADSSLEKYTFSNGIALSVKLGIWEASLEKFIDSIEFISEDLKAGRKIRMTREEVLRKHGELFALRHLLNLSSDFLDTPDFYWDNEELERLYLQTINYFCISRRTRVMNEKISHCAGLVELVSSHLSDKHHIRLEWMIIVLIMVEVGFEFLHYVDPK
ncbi:required for meiotic nuclear division protein 1 homolog [Frankliniella occidentalis]|uniref:Required for meiotic nuclear division protein 1 homolog n=1 Tax=Frankliniella occidentalis TaxID=133901 RepID=A0A6J1TIG0_FRAOC|nr:required for meiotic nuclear division protein 1 homolog [Frankliniella occidentalis]